MKHLYLLIAFAILGSLLALEAANPRPVSQSQSIVAPNPIINYDAFLGEANEVLAYRKKRRVTESTFLELAKFPDTVILDTRSAARFRQIHVKGAVHLNFSDITKESLAKAIPNKDTRILIYCNNNFDGDPVNFASKSAEGGLEYSDVHHPALLWLQECV